jgi:cell division protein FtsQ
MTADKRRRRWGGIVALLTIGAALGTWAAAASPLFHVRDVRVRGNRHLSASEIVRLAEIGTDANLLTVQPNRVLRGLARNPWVRTAQVRRDLPSTLVLTVEERFPVAWVRQGRGVALVAGDGTVLARRRKPPQGTVDIGAGEGRLRPGDHLEGLEEPLTVVGSLPSRLRRQVERASMRRGEVVLRLGGGARILYGDPRALEAKNAAMTRVLRWAGEQGAELAYVDLRVARNPAVRIRGA